MLLYISFISLIFLNSFVITLTNIKNCYCSRFMVYFFHLNDIAFKSKFVYFNERSFSLEDLNIHSDSLQSQGETVLAMLDELHRSHPNPSLSEDLMKINLYLNNVTGTLLVRTLGGSNIDSGNDINLYYKKEFNKMYVEIIQTIRRSIQNICPFERTWVVKDKNMDDKEVDPYSTEGLSYEDLNNLLPNKYEHEIYAEDKNKLEQQMKHLCDSAMEMKHIIKPILKKNTFSDFHPKKLLFYHLLSRDEYKINGNIDLPTDDPDHIGLILGVTLNEKLVNGNHANIAILFEMMQRVFNPSCLRSFQQQILAATAHPVLTVVGSYVLLVKHIFYTGNNKFKDVPKQAELFLEKIIDLGNSIHHVFEKFINLNIFPKRVQKHLHYTLDELRELIDYPSKENIQTVLPDWMDTIFRRCSNPMVINNLNFITEDHSMNLESEKKCTDIIDTIKTNTSTIQIYVEQLKKYEEDYAVVVKRNKYISHENMFLVDENHKLCNIVRDNKYGYAIILPEHHSNHIYSLQEV